jgi:hypothetical protein
MYLVRFFLKRFLKDKKFLLLMFFLVDMVNFTSQPNDSLVTSFLVLSFIPFVLTGNYLSDPFDKGILDIFIIKFGRKTYYLALAVSIFMLMVLYVCLSGILRLIFVSSTHVIYNDRIFWLIHYQYLISLIYIVGLAMFYSSFLKSNHPLIIYTLGHILLIIGLATYGILFNPEISPLLYLSLKNIYLILIAPTTWIDNNNALIYYLTIAGIGIIMLIMGLKMFLHRDKH